MDEDAKRYCGGWINRQPELFPWLEEEIDPVTAKLERLIIILDTLGLEAFVDHRLAAVAARRRIGRRSPVPLSPRRCSPSRPLPR